MKNRNFLLIGLSLVLFCSFLNFGKADAQTLSPENSISFYSTPELYELTTEWAAVFCKLNPEVDIKVVNVPGHSFAESLNDSKNLGFVSGEYDSVMYTESLWKVVIGRDVIVPVFNSGNPFKDEISLEGISPSEFAQLINNPGMTNWGSLVKTGNKAPVNLYVVKDESINSGIAKFINADQVNIDGLKVVDSRGDLVAAVQGDKYAIGICKITDVVDPGDQSILENIGLLPIDNNGNGTIDFKEEIYGDLDAFSRGVWIGKYPRALCNNIYSVSTTQPTNENELAFLKWILTRGHVLLDNHGYSELEDKEILAQVSFIDGYEIPTTYAQSKEPPFFSSNFPIILAVVIAMFFITISLVNNIRERKTGVPVSVAVPRLALNEDFVKSLPGLYYDKTHTWAFMDRDGMVKVGIDDFLQHITGPLTRVKMKLPGERIKKGRPALSIVQDGKQLDICAPVSGTIKEKNKILTSNTSIINSSPYTEGWIYKVEPTNWLKEIQFLIMGTNYKEWLKSEFSRLKEFLTDSVRNETVEYAHVLQDGGELKDRILEDLGPEVWEDFQTNFIDVSS
ncbi:hypothetical protein ACFLTU_05360 [Bacteroidota bacterium]